jgi:hypothetical protein
MKKYFLFAALLALIFSSPVRFGRWCTAAALDTLSDVMVLCLNRCAGPLNSWIAGTEY